MKKLNSQNIQVKIQQLFMLLQRGDCIKVITELQPLLIQYPRQSDLWHLAAIAYKSDNQLDLSIKHYKMSLDINNKQPQVYNNLANVYKQLKNFDLAEKNYEMAVDLDSKYIDAWKNLGLLYFNENKFEKAQVAFSRVIDLDNKEISALTSLGNIYKAQDEYLLSIKYYKMALVINPNYVNALHNLGLVYKLNEQLDLALACFKKAKYIAPEIAEIDYNEANTYFEQGHYPEAEQGYWNSLNKAPDNIEVHQTLNEFYWQTGRKVDFGRSFKLAIEHLPSNINLRHAFAESLLSSGNIAQAQQVLNAALAINETPALLHLKGKLAVSDNELSMGILAVEASLKQLYDLDVALDLIELLIIDYQYDKALKYIGQAELIAPLNQLLIAYKSVCWRLTQNEKYHWLNDYQAYIKTYEIPVPNGYSSRESFLLEVQDVLLSMHKTQHEPLKQTLRHGTQTPGRLFYKPLPQIVALKTSFELITREYIHSLPNDLSHPLLSRKSQKLSFAGSWSVKLKPNGFHVNHVHPKGWLSSCFYINVPDFLSHKQPSTHAGAIKFGESSMGLGERESIGRIIAPNAGTVVIFPSYVWHGTFPFHGADKDFRLTAPCDITPLGNNYEKK